MHVRLRVCARMHFKREHLVLCPPPKSATTQGKKNETRFSVLRAVFLHVHMNVHASARRSNPTFSLAFLSLSLACRGFGERSSRAAPHAGAHVCWRACAQDESKVSGCCLTAALHGEPHQVQQGTASHSAAVVILHMTTGGGGSTNGMATAAATTAASNRALTAQTAAIVLPVPCSLS